ncbi:MAG: hypothetical protein FKY71_13900 [Spiribacter salinus]|uniref:Uncharacterized protein n=1 Tax=Spiribacter salinus TaxID=1335746 RepID=A0A540VNY4_9GAMM|nr:MAG: hypothetical protein FKY71_13900 [Spiribacter salinus]
MSQSPGHRVAALLALLAVAWIAYWPGLSSGFHFDDFGNLPLLGRYGQVDDWQSFWLYVLSGFAGQTGRPLSLLSFLIDANNWPTDPWPFKRTNVVIHLSTGVVLFGLLRQCALALGYASRPASWGALLAVGLWLLHPFWVSTTLYAVQRMALLSTLFVFIGLWGWMHLRLCYPPRMTARWLLGGLLAVWGAGALAVLSKENGALLPCLILVLEGTVLTALDTRRGQQSSKGLRWLKRILLGIPIAALVIYLAPRMGDLFNGVAGSRHFTPGERLLTQGRILWEYIFHIAVPTPYPGGLYNDGIQVSKGLLTPWTTAVAWTAWLGVLYFAVRNRKQYPAVAAAILFFMVGHVLESTFIQLELYFEHRNYLPAALLPLPLALLAVRQTVFSRRTTCAVVLTLLAGLATMTAVRADLWSKPFQQALTWAEQNPQSARAQNHLANYWQETGHLEEAARLTQRAIDLEPDGLAWRIRAVQYTCMRGEEPKAELDAVKSVLPRDRGVGAVGGYQVDKLLDYLDQGACPGYEDDAAILSLFQELRQNGPDDPAYKRLFLVREGQIELERGNIDAALSRFASLLQASDDPAIQLNLAARLASAGVHEAALELLDREPPRSETQTSLGMTKIRNWYLDTTAYYENEREHLRKTIRENMDDS